MKEIELEKTLKTIEDGTEKYIEQEYGDVSTMTKTILRHVLKNNLYNWLHEKNSDDKGDKYE